MKKAKEMPGRKCPICGKTENQVNAGKNHSRTQKCFCNDCKKYYTLEPKAREYPEEIRQQAIKHFMRGQADERLAKHLASAKQMFTTRLKKRFKPRRMIVIFWI